jgi:uncharacterized membrane protein YuzA (DUF378 family)
MHFGEENALTATVYLLVGVSGLYQLLASKAMQRKWAEPVAASHRQTTGNPGFRPGICG